MKDRILFLLLLLGFYRSMAIAPPLEREINISFSNEPIRSALNKIQDQTGLVFSYKASLMENVAPISADIKQRTVREALALILPKSISFKAKNNYIILKEKPPEKDPKKTELSGYVIDKNTNKKLPNVTIYDKKTLQAVTTDEFGYYSITVPKTEECLKVNKENYRDTCIALNPDDNLVNISIDQLSEIQSRTDTVAERRRLREFSRYTNNMFRKFKGYINTINVRDTFSRGFQASLVPFLGSNGLMSGNVYNKYSINIFGGYSRGTRALELGGFFNVNREKMRGLQMAGFFNVVGDSVKGLQMAGFFNATGGSVSGVQLSGFCNTNFGSVNGVQGTGFLNFNWGKVNGFQISGLANVNAKGIDGISMAGFVNANFKTVEGIQMSGMLNLCLDTLSGAAMAGFVNLTRYSNRALEMSGFTNLAVVGNRNQQVSGLFNATVKGSTNFQMSALFNRAHKLTGVQLGILNYADTASGVPIGLFSIVKHGIHQLEFSSDELFNSNFSFRSGVPSLYNIISYGTQLGKRTGFWHIGYGLGTSVKLTPKLRSDFTATWHHVSQYEFYHATSEMYKFYLGFEYKFFKKFSVAGGPTFNLYWSDALLPDYTGTYSQVVPNVAFNKSLANNFNLKGWYGGKISLRFF